MSEQATQTRATDTKTRLLDSAHNLVLEKGFAATSLDDILKETGVTKGAFFHHFRSKGDLAQQLVQRFAENDFVMFDEFSRRADALSDDPLQAALIFLKLFEEWFENLPTPFAGCLFAVYVYESGQFGAEVNDFISESFKRWQLYYEKKFEAVMAVRKPTADVTAKDLAEMIVSLLEGAFILSRSYGDRHLIPRQSAQFRNYLHLLFAD